MSEETQDTHNNTHKFEIVDLSKEVYVLYDVFDFDEYDLFNAIKSKYDVCLVVINDNDAYWLYHDNYTVKCSGELEPLETELIRQLRTVGERLDEEHGFFSYETLNELVNELANYVMNKMNAKPYNITVYSVILDRTAYIIQYK